MTNHLRSDDGAAVRLDESVVEAEDLFIEIWVTYQVLPEATGPELPDPVELDDFDRTDEWHGAPLREIEALGPDGGIYSLRYWAGPDAEGSQIVQLERLIESAEFVWEPGVSDA